MDSIYELDDKNDKKNCSGSGVYASSQTFGYDNSVTSYNLDFYDYIENVDNWFYINIKYLILWINFKDTKIIKENKKFYKF